MFIVVFGVFHGVDGDSMVRFFAIAVSAIAGLGVPISFLIAIVLIRVPFVNGCFVYDPRIGL